MADAVAISGTLDAVVHCAGIGGRAPAEDYPLDLFDRVMAVNAGGTFLVSQAAGRVMLKQEKGGAIVNLSSIGGVVGKAGQRRLPDVEGDGDPDREEPRRRVSAAGRQGQLDRAGPVHDRDDPAGDREGAGRERQHAAHPAAG